MHVVTKSVPLHLVQMGFPHSLKYFFKPRSCLLNKKPHPNATMGQGRGAGFQPCGDLKLKVPAFNVKDQVDAMMGYRYPTPAEQRLKSRRPESNRHFLRHCLPHLDVPIVVSEVTAIVSVLCLPLPFGLPRGIQFKVAGAGIEPALSAYLV